MTTITDADVLAALRDNGPLTTKEVAHFVRKPLLWWLAMSFSAFLAGAGANTLLFADFWLGSAAVGFALLLASTADAAYRGGHL